MNFEKLTAYLDSLEEGYGVPGNDCLVYKDHELVYRHQCGFCDYEKKVPMHDTVLYDLYSCSKVVTMTACMQLIEKGLLDLEAPVSKYLPEFKDVKVADNWDLKDFRHMPNQESPAHPAKTPILIKQLMSMTAGMSYNTTSEPIKDLREKTNDKATTREMMTALAKMPLLFDPGTSYAYSLGHDVMAGVVEVITGKTFHEYVFENILGPLGVTDAYYQLTDREKERLMAQYSMNFMTGEMTEQQGNTFRLSDLYDSGGAGLTTTAEGYAAVLVALANDGVGLNGAKILKRETIDILRKPMLDEVQQELFWPKDSIFHVGYGYGLGVRTLIDASTSKSPVGEFGWDGAAGSYALMDPENHIAVCYTQQILGLAKAYSEIHPTIRDLVYECIEAL